MAWRNRNRAFDDQDDQDYGDDWARDQQALTDVLQEDNVSAYSRQPADSPSSRVSQEQAPNIFEPAPSVFNPPPLVAMSSAFDGRERELPEPDFNVPTPMPPVVTSPPPPTTTTPATTPPTTWQMPSAAGQTGTSVNAPRLVQNANGQWVLREHNNQRVLQPSEAASAQQYVSDFWRQFPTGFQPQSSTSLQDAYRQFLGREASPEELASHAGNPGGLAGIIQTIASSPEAQAYQTRQSTTTPTSQPTTTQPTRDQIARGTVGTMRGFEQGDYGGDVKARTSVKNMFGRIAQRYANRPSSIDAILADPDFKRLFPNAKRVPGGANDKIDFGGVLSDFETGTPVGIVDVLEASDPSRDVAAGWAWMPDTGTTTPTRSNVPSARSSAAMASALPMNTGQNAFGTNAFAGGAGMGAGAGMGLGAGGIDWSTWRSAGASGTPGNVQTQFAAPVSLASAAPGSAAPGSAGMGSVASVSAPAAPPPLGLMPTVAAAAPASAFAGQVQNAIGRDLGAATFDANDPVLQAQLASFRAANQRATERQRAQEAQRANVGGTIGSGGFNTRMRGLDEAQAIRDTDFEAQLVASELAQARERAERARSLGAGLVSQELQQDLAARLANQQAAMTGLGLQNQRDLAQQGYGMQAALANQQAGLTGRGQDLNRELGLQELGLRRYLADAQREIDMNEALIRRNALELQQTLGLSELDLRRLGLSQQDAQFYAGLGAQQGMDLARLNQQALLALLGARG